MGGQRTKSSATAGPAALVAVKRHSKFKGVSWDGAAGAWRVQILVAGKRLILGSFAREGDAAAAYDAKAFGLGKPVNFPERFFGENGGVPLGSSRRRASEQEERLLERASAATAQDADTASPASTASLSAVPPSAGTAEGPAHASSQSPGVHWSEGQGAWKVQAAVGGRLVHLGLFAARQEALDKFSEVARHHPQPLPPPPPLPTEGGASATKKRGSSSSSSAVSEDGARGKKHRGFHADF